MNPLQSDSSGKAPVARHRKPSLGVACVAVGVDVKVAWVVVVAWSVVVLSSTALVLWHPGTNDSGKQVFLVGSNAKLSGQGLLTATLTEHSM
jgi:hypothetical protein